MKKFVLVLTFIILVSGFAFAEFQLEPSFGWFFNIDDYDGATKRTFNGLNTNITLRYFFIENIGLFFGGDFKAWFSAYNDNYINQLQSNEMQVIIDNDTGYKLDLFFGLSLAYSINYNFGIQWDLGLSATVWSTESIIGTMKNVVYDISTDIFIDKIYSMGFYYSIFGNYFLGSIGNIKSYLTFGARIDYKFNRDETVEVVTDGISQEYSGKKTNFSGFAITPSIGYMGSF
ncbi:MAG: hypothetical protein LBI04_00455 [Treponema sp.]|jgi:hypothetical protein|nr:hypothetical protein [Treponema sp.]